MGIVQVPGRHEVGGWWDGELWASEQGGDEGNSHFGSQFVTVVATLRKNMRELLMSIVKYCKGIHYWYSTEAVSSDVRIVILRCQNYTLRCENCYSEVSELYLRCKNCISDVRIVILRCQNCILRCENCILRFQNCVLGFKIEFSNVRIVF